MKLFLLVFLFSSSVWAGTFTQGQIITAGDMSQATASSTGISIKNFSNIAIQAVYTGAPVGTFVIKTSADTTNDYNLVANWTIYPSSTAAIAAAGNSGWTLTNIGWKWIQLVYTKTSGTGTLNATLNAKDSIN